MFELPRFTPVRDNTGALLMKAAEQARQDQMNFASLIQKNEQLRSEAFGSMQKQIMDIASANNVPVEVQRSILKQGLDGLTALYKDRKNVRATELGMMASDILANAKTAATAYQQYLANGEKAIADAEKDGWNSLNLRTALAKNMFEEREEDTPMGRQIVRVPKSPDQLPDAIQLISSEKFSDPQKYVDRAKSEKRLSDGLQGYKPGELKMSTSRDLTGDMTVKVAYTEKSYPFTRTEDVQVDGLTAKRNVLDLAKDTDLSKTLGRDVNILSDRAWPYFRDNPDPIIRAEVYSKGRDYIDAHNRRLGVNPQQITPANVKQLAMKYPGMIDPFDAGNRETFSRLAMTEYLMPQFGQFGDISVSRDRAKQRAAGGGDSDGLRTKAGDVKASARFPLAVAQALGQDPRIMQAAKNAIIEYNGQKISGKRTGDIVHGQIVKDNGKKATIISNPGEVDVAYVVEINQDGTLSDNVERYEGQQAVDYFATVAAANSSNFDDFVAKFPEARTQVTPVGGKALETVKKTTASAAARQAGADLISKKRIYASIKDGEVKDIGNAAIKYNGEDVVVTKIERKKPNWWWQSGDFVVTLADGRALPFSDLNEFFKNAEQPVSPKLNK